MSTYKDPDLVSRPIDVELWREYEWLFDGHIRTYRIDKPTKLYYRKGGTTHRIVDTEHTVHCVPAPGKQGCVLRWKNQDGASDVNF